jgi:prolyl oligopeptidase
MTIFNNFTLLTFLSSLMKIIPFLVVILSTSILFSQTKKNNSVEITKFNHSFVDEYIWLEDVNSNSTAEWIENQNNSSKEVINKTVKKHDFLFKIKDYDYLSTNSLPLKIGKYYYSKYRLHKNKPSVLHFRENLNDSPKELVDPYRVYKSEDVLLLGYYPSRNSKFLAYEVSKDGSDKHEIRFVDIAKQEYLADVLTDIKFSNIAWKYDEGIFYKKNTNKVFFEKDSTFQLYYHKINDSQTNDKLIFDTTDSENKFSFTSQDDKLFLIESNKNETLKNYYYINKTGDDNFAIIPFIKDDPNSFEFIKYRNDFIYCQTKSFPWGSISKFNINNPDEKSIVIPQIYNHLLIKTYFLDQYIVAKYKHLGKFYINIYDFEGNFIRKFEAPYGMDFSIRFYNKKTDELFVTFFSHTISFLNYRLNMNTGENKIYFNDFIRPKPTLFPFDYFTTKTITYKSRDGKDVPITIIHKKNINLDGNNPTLLKAYGGFGLISSPNYDTGLLHFLEKGGVYAYAEIRGGGDKGTNWHKNGSGKNKMNSFNDFVDAAEFLISEKYTSANKLAITGSSHGGLVVGVAITQRPDLFKVAIPVVGVFDMYNFDKYTVGKYHLDEFGDPNIKEDFEQIMKYSPLHNIKEDINYPTTLVITSRNDDRVPPIHSYKFVAKLQNRASQKNPIYLQVVDKAGHYGNISNYKNQVSESAEFYSFIWEHLNN